MPVVQHVELTPSGELELQPEETIRMTQENVVQHSPFYEGSSSGTLIITNQCVLWSVFCVWTSSNWLYRRVAWINSGNKAQSSSYRFRDISLHAMAQTAFGEPCLYCHLDTEDVTEIRFIPSDKDGCEWPPAKHNGYLWLTFRTVQPIYQAFCQGAMENPDSDEEEPMDAWISSALEEDDEAEEGQFDDA